MHALLTVHCESCRAAVWRWKCSHCLCWAGRGKPSQRRHVMPRLQPAVVMSWTTLNKSMYVDAVTNSLCLYFSVDAFILNSIWQRKHRWIGHVLTHDGLLCEIIDGRMKGKPTRGRRKIQMLHDLANDGGFAALKRAAEDREGWRHRERMTKTCCTAEDYWWWWWYKWDWHQTVTHTEFECIKWCQ